MIEIIARKDMDRYDDLMLKVPGKICIMMH